MAKDVAAVNNSLPAHLQGKQKTVKVGNIDRSDLIVPRVKLLQAISPEVDAFDVARAGEFWHTLGEVSLGKELVAVPVILRKSYALWAPRGDDRGILARAADAIHWDVPAGTEFTIKPKGQAHPITYKLGATVNEPVDGKVALSEFGSSIPGDPQSPPAAALTYEILWFFPDFMEMSPSIIINTRSSVKPAKDLINKIEMRPVDHYYQQYTIGVHKEPYEDGFFYNYKYTSNGYASEEIGEKARELYEFYNKSDWRPSDATEDVAKGEDVNHQPNPEAGKGKKF